MLRVAGGELLLASRTSAYVKPEPHACRRCGCLSCWFTNEHGQTRCSQCPEGEHAKAA